MVVVVVGSTGVSIGSSGMGSSGSGSSGSSGTGCGSASSNGL